MENPVETMCRLCLSSVTHENSEIIDKPVRDVLGILLPRWNLDEDKHLICNDCSTKLFAALDFKRTCVNTENCIFPYVNSEKEGLLDLQEIYSKENDSKLSISEIRNVCRLCMQLIFGECKRLEQLDFNMLNTYIPEINFSFTKNPVICEACYEAFESHSVFLMTCLENQKIKYVNHGTSCFNTQEVYLKPEEVYVKPEEVYIKVEEPDKSDLEEAAYETEEQCNFEISNTQQEQLPTHTDPFQVLMYECDECSYKTKVKGILRRHKLRHSNPCEVKLFTCDECSFKTRHKKSLNTHKLIHRDPSEVQMYECDECSYKTRVKGNLRKHKLQHRDPSEVQMFTCDECGFETKYKKSLRTHKLTHGDPFETQMFKCDKCSFTSCRKSDLYRHELVHKDASEIQMFQCDECSYKTKHSKDLRTHKLIHKDPSEVQMYECDECSYKTRVKGNLRKHKLKHRDPSEVQMYECDECSYMTMDKSNLRAHKLTHRDPSEREVYLCEKCARQFKYKVGLKNHMLKGCVDGRGVQHKFDDPAQQILGCCVAPVKVEG